MTKALQTIFCKASLSLVVLGILEFYMKKKVFVSVDNDRIATLP
jgi:hypothetical protein